MGDAADDLEWQDYRSGVMRPTDREIWSDSIYAAAPLSDLQKDLIRCAQFLSACPHPKKVEFRSQAKARKRARQLHMNFYRCVCGVWHLTRKHFDIGLHGEIDLAERMIDDFPFEDWRDGQ